MDSLVPSPRFHSHVALQDPPTETHPPPPPPASLISTTSSPSLHVTIRYTAIQREIIQYGDRLRLVREITESQPYSFVLGTLGMLHIRPARIFRTLAAVLTRLGIPDPHHEQLGLSLTRNIDELTRDLPRTRQDLRVVWTVERRDDDVVRNLALDESMMSAIFALVAAGQGSGDDGNGMVPTAPGALAKLMTVEVESSAGEKDCSICLDDLVTGGETTTATAMPCKHLFHEQCIVSWLKRSHYCPICRFEMPTAAEAPAVVSLTINM